ncbi:tetratricopeptide repeat protein [Rubrivirga sp. IMCC45206]|uniref:tetratricopeptide repeat protein n=1 Tax=Rubrivirga sp. IMCC45206 TaxID=3391614 RepID=UPI00398FAC96
MTRFLALVALLALVASAPLAQDLGETEFANSGAAEAQEPFLRGLLLLHSFEYDDAREAFQQARALDPDFAMAAWGEAMTHNHPVWQRQDRDAMRAALDGVETFPKTPRELDYLGTLSVLAGEGEKDERDDAYAEAMRELADAYPDDLDARAFYALALLGTAHEGRDFATYMQAAAVAEEVFAENPRHPGAAHYLIHAYDDPVHAPLGLRPARAYADIAPSASHALHMPSHIYLALGLWDDVAAMNERSYLAAKAGTDRRGEALNGHGWHALWWWHYAALQLGDVPLADRLLALARDLDDGSGTATAHRVRIGAQHAMATADDSGLGDPPSLDVGVSTLAVDALPRVTMALVRGEEGRAREVLATLAAAVRAAGDVPWHAEATLWMVRSALDTYAGNEPAAIEKLERAAQLEREAPLTFGPPAPVKMANEMLGAAWAMGGRWAEARGALEAALARAPERRSVIEWLDAVEEGERAAATGGE